MTLKTTLYEHQQAAVDKLLPIKIGALYMEMGTGKTRTALEIIQRRVNAGRIDKVLWLCPCSVKSTITAELSKHIADNASVISIHGIESLSTSIRLYTQLDTMTANYTTMLVVDESNLVKNHMAKRTVNIKRLAARCPYRLVLNGTPVSRTEADLYAQWDILDWRVLGYRSFWSFAANHIEYDDINKTRIRRCLNVDYLSEKIAPYTYQVRKVECLTLPDKVEHTEYFDLDKNQTLHYYDVVDFYLPSPEVEEWRSEAIYRLFTAGQQVASGRRLVLNDYSDPISSSPFFARPEHNPRIIALLNTITRIDGKILIWCKYTHEIEDVSAILAERYGGNAVACLYGKMSLNARNKSLVAFDGPARFLVGNKSCGGYGLNLEHCSDVIYYNNDFDWAGRAQSEDRVHRIGQHNKVCITNICAASTIDERVLDNLDKKTRLVESFKQEIDRVKNKRDFARRIMTGVRERATR